MFTSLPEWDTRGFAYCRVYCICKGDLAVENAINACNSLDLMEENPFGGAGGEFSIPKRPNELLISASREPTAAGSFSWLPAIQFSKSSFLRDGQLLKISEEQVKYFR